MTDLGILRRIRDHDENSAVALARMLVLAEGGRHSLPSGFASFTGRVKAPDGGVDGRTTIEEPAPEGLLLPGGQRIWQVKSGRSAPVAAKEFDPAKRQGLIDEIRNGWDYVLFWANDPEDPAGQKVRAEFTETVKAIRSDVEIAFIFTDDIERLCYAHLGVLAQIAPVPLGGVVTLEVWAPAEFEKVEFRSDPVRESALSDLRSLVSSWDAEPNALHVCGDTGVGKSRLVYEALRIEGLRERVLVVADATRWDAGLLAAVAQFEERSLILVVDDCGHQERRSLARQADMARGRIRLITIGSHHSRERSVSDSRYIDVPPLEVEACKEIALSVGLDEQSANVVAGFTEGYPGLALTLSKAILRGAGEDSLIERIRGHEELGPVLASLLPGEDVPLLGMIALFERLGFEGELAEEMTIACEKLGVDEPALRRVVDRETHRFVSTAGRYRRVSPRLFAVWLASEFLSSRADVLAAALTDLPPFLRERIVEQMGDFAGDPVVESTLGVILNEFPFVEGALADVDEGAARLLHVAAVSAPASTIAAIERVLHGLSVDEVRSYTVGRRELVWALETLLWFDEFFERAAEVLLHLSFAENETWANNATKVLCGVFRVHLGGTSTPFERRIEWARNAMSRYGAAAVSVLIEGLGHALESHETRSGIEFGGRSAPPEWRPSTVDEEQSSRRAAWELLMALGRDNAQARALVAKELAQGLRTAVRRGLVDDVVRDLPSVEWDAPSRAALGDALAKLLKYDKPPPSIADRLRPLMETLHGADLHSRLEYALSLSPWQLSSEDEDRRAVPPQLLVSLGTELAASGLAAIEEAAKLTLGKSDQSAGMLFAVVAEQSQKVELLERLAEQDPRPDAALLGCFAGFARSYGDDWADQQLASWLEGPQVRLVIPAAHGLVATATRAELVTAAARHPDVPQSDLARLLYGAWAKPLPEPQLLELLEELAVERDEHSLEHAMGILDQWLEGREGEAIGTRLRMLGDELIARSIEVDEGSSGMLGFHRARLIVGLGMVYEARLQTFLQRLRSLETFLDDSDLAVLDSLTDEDPERTLHAILDVVTSDAEVAAISTLWLEQSKLLSRIINRSGNPEVLAARMLDETEAAVWRSLVDHLDFGTEDPDPAVVEMLDRSHESDITEVAVSRFAYPRNAWFGSDASHLEERRAVAERWHAAAEPGTGFSAWLEVVLDRLGGAIDAAQLREAERGY